MIDALRAAAVDSSTALEFYGAVATLNTATPVQSVEAVDTATTVQAITPLEAISRQNTTGRRLGYVIDTYA